MNDLAALASDPSTAAIGGAVAGLALKELVARFLRRAEKLETARENKQESLFARLLDDVESMRRSLEVMVERLTNHQASVSEVKERVDEHGGRISALEVGHAALATRVEILDRGGRDDA